MDDETLRVIHLAVKRIVRGEVGQRVVPRQGGLASRTAIIVVQLQKVSRIFRIDLAHSTSVADLVAPALASSGGGCGCGLWFGLRVGLRLWFGLRLRLRLGGLRLGLGLTALLGRNGVFRHRSFARRNDHGAYDRRRFSAFPCILVPVDRWGWRLG